MHDRRTAVALLAGAPLATLLPGCAKAVGTADAVSLPDFRRSGDVDDSNALTRAFATGRPVHAPGGRGSGKQGVYVVGNDAAANLPSGALLYGDGRDRTVITRTYKTPKAFILHCDSGSPDRTHNIAGLRFHDLTFADEIGRGFEPYSYLLMLNGVTDVSFERVGFRGFRGDALHLGSSVTPKTERHNARITIRDCVFDGINSNNRNAISIIDGEQILIERCAFMNVSRQGDGTVNDGDPMNPLTGISAPGPIDFEPNGDAFAIIRDIVVRHNRFARGGGFAVNMLLVSNAVLKVPARNIVIEDNVVEDRFGAFHASGFAGDDATTNQRSYDIAIRRNTVSRCGKPFIIDGIRGVIIADNRFIDCAEHAELGYVAQYADASVTGNEFLRVGKDSSGQALWVRGGTGATITGNRFVDSGRSDARSGVAIAFVGGNVRRLQLTGNVFSAPTNRTAEPVVAFKDARIDRSTAKISGNQQLMGGQPIMTLLAPALH